LFDTFSIKQGLKQGASLWPLLFNFALECTIKKVQANQEGLKLNGTHELLVYAVDDDILFGSVYSTQKNTEALAVTSKEAGIEVNGDKTKYTVMSRYQHAGQNQRREEVINTLNGWNI
jgi:hypothetical protein